MAGSIRRQSKGSWSVTIDLGRDQTGRRQRKFITVRGSKADAERALTAALSKRDQGIDINPQQITLGEFLERWLRDYAEVQLKRSTVERYRGIIRSHIIPALGHVRLADLRQAQIQATYTQWFGPKSRLDGRGSLSPRTVQHHHRLLRKALQSAFKWGLIHRNPCDAVDAPSVPATEMQALDLDQVKRMLAEAKVDPLYAFFHLAVVSGARLGELQALRWQDVNFTIRMTITRSVRRFKGDGFVFSAPKSHRSRRPVALDAHTIKVLQEHRRLQIEERLLVGPAYQDQDLVFATPLGKVVPDSTIRAVLRRVLGRAGLPEIRIHDLRHTAATLLMIAGTNPRVVSDRLGHSSVKITLDTYSHVVPDLQQEAADDLAEMIR